MQPDAQSRPGWSAYWMLAVVTTLSVSSMLDRQVIGLLIPFIKADFGVSDLQVSLVSGAAFAIFYCLAGLPIGYAVDNFPRRIVIFVGVFTWALATMACGLAGTFTQLAMARFAVGIGEAALSPAAYSLFGDKFPRNRLGFATAVFGIGATFGTALAYGLGGRILAWLPDGGLDSPFGHLVPWQATFVIAALPALCVLPLILTFAEPARQRTAKARLGFTEGLSFVMARKGFFLPYFVANGCLLASAWAFSMWVPTILVRRFGIAMQDAASLLGLLAAVGAISGAIITGTVTDRLISRGYSDAPMRTFAVLGASLGIAGLLFALTPSFKWAVAGGLLLFICSGIPAMASAIPMAVPARLRGQVSAIYLLIGNLMGLGVGPTIVALFTDYVYRDENMVHWALATTLLIMGPAACILLLIARRPMREAVAALDDELRKEEEAVALTPVLAT